MTRWRPNSLRQASPWEEANSVFRVEYSDPPHTYHFIIVPSRRGQAITKRSPFRRRVSFDRMPPYFCLVILYYGYEYKRTTVQQFIALSFLPDKIPSRFMFKRCLACLSPKTVYYYNVRSLYNSYIIISFDNMNYKILQDVCLFLGTLLNHWYIAWRNMHRECT